jgi:uncharacterized protein
MEELTRSRLIKVSIRTSLAVMLLFIVSVALGSQPSKTAWQRIVFKPGGVTVLAEKADSPQKRSQGLMNRASLGQKEGMIFNFEENGYQTFWMYNTRVPLTIIFLNDRLKIVDIQDMQPCVQSNPDLCRTYTSRGVARYAIEVNQGFAEKHGIKIGDQVIIEKAE